jgi:hypothetical protein
MSVTAGQPHFGPDSPDGGERDDPTGGGDKLMGGELQLLNDGRGLAVIGHTTDVERFLRSEGLPSRDLESRRLSAVLGKGSAAAQAGAGAAESGRWVKLTAESANRIREYGLTPSTTPGVSHAMLGPRGSIHSWLQIQTGAGSMLTNPAVLSGAAGIMAQVAMQQAMDEITDYLARIDSKLDDVIRAQKDTVVADMLGVGLVIEEAMTIRDQVGRVSEVTWSKVQATSLTIARTQAYAVRQLDALAEKLENEPKIGDLAETAKAAQSTVQEWLVVLAHCVQLQEALGVLELDRMLDAAPDELDLHRLGLESARQNRIELLANSTERLMARLDAAAGAANLKVLLHPTTAPAVVQASNHAAGAIADFRGRFGLEPGRQSLEARRWAAAAGEAKDKALTTGVEGVDAAKRLGQETFNRARSGTGKLAGCVVDRARRRRAGDVEE